jgi:hypothetical protein
LRQFARTEARQYAELFQRKANLHPTGAGPTAFVEPDEKRCGFDRIAKTAGFRLGERSAEEASHQPLKDRHEKVHRRLYPFAG